MQQCLNRFKQFPANNRLVRVFDVILLPLTPVLFLSERQGVRSILLLQERISDIPLIFQDIRHAILTPVQRVLAVPSRNFFRIQKPCNPEFSVSLQA